MLASEKKLLRTKNRTWKQGYQVHTSECYLATDEIARYIIGWLVLSPLSNIDIRERNRIRLTELNWRFKYFHRTHLYFKFINFFFKVRKPNLWQCCFSFDSLNVYLHCHEKKQHLLEINSITLWHLSVLKTISEFENVR